MRNAELLLIALVLMISGCDGFLGVEPRTFTSTTNFYKNQDQIEQAVNGVYAELQTLYHVGGGTDFWAVTEMRSDNTTYQFNPADRGEFQMEAIDEFLVNDDNSDLEAIWSAIYSGIQQTNTILSRIDQATFTDEDLRAQLEGEAKFMRAFYYFHLVRLWGGVPLVLEEVNSPDLAFSEGRASESAVYEQILSDAQEASEFLPSSYSSSNVGRATKGAAHMLLAKVHMTRENYGDAATELEAVMDQGYSLIPDYADVFDPANKNNQESIFEIQFEPGVANGAEASAWIYRFAPFNSEGDVVFGFPDLAFNFAGYNIPTFDMVRAYEDGDERKEASIAFYENPDNRQYDVAIGDSIPFIAKYYHEFSTQGQTAENWPVYRYADALLMYAEALNEQGQTGQAHTYLNQVRERAGLEPLGGLSQQEFREAVHHEQRVELAFENHRWYQLKRTDRALEVMSAHGEEMVEQYERLTPIAYDIAEYKLLYPIPFREVRLNNLEQNPGW